MSPGCLSCPFDALCCASYAFHVMMFYPYCPDRDPNCHVFHFLISSVAMPLLSCYLCLATCFILTIHSPQSSTHCWRVIWLCYLYLFHHSINTATLDVRRLAFAIQCLHQSFPETDPLIIAQPKSLTPLLARLLNHSPLSLITLDLIPVSLCLPLKP